jgi:hypothetical protein
VQGLLTGYQPLTVSLSINRAMFADVVKSIVLTGGCKKTNPIVMVDVQAKPYNIGPTAAEAAVKSPIL